MKQLHTLSSLITGGQLWLQEGAWHGHVDLMVGSSLLCVHAFARVRMPAPLSQVVFAKMCQESNLSIKYYFKSNYEYSDHI